MALFAYDERALAMAWQSTPGRELAARIGTAQDRTLGPLLPLRQEIANELAALGDDPPAARGFRSQRALEAVALLDAYAFTGGEAVGFVDGRLLPIFSLTSGDPAFDEGDADELAELEEKASVLEAMVEVLPFRSPEGGVLEQIADEELRPLPPWFEPGEEYVGAMFALRPERLYKLVAGLDQRELAGRIDRFFRAWWKAQRDEPAGDEYVAWRRGSRGWQQKRPENGLSG